jgi:peptidoglycan hydrolase-like protein with peptidoglycan-binding domain
MIDAPYTGACTRWDSFSTTEQTGVLQYSGATRPAALAISAAPSPAASMVDVKLPTLQQGSTGKAVKALQILLGSNLVPDGVFGKLTTRVVKNFQYINYLAVDGVVGVHTWGTLLGCPQ